MRTRSQLVLGATLALLLGGCSDDDEPAARPTPSASATASPSATAIACEPFAGAPDGSAKRPYLKRSMAFTCREDVKVLQEALGLPADGRFDFDTAAAVIARQQPYRCITANDGQVGPQTWDLIVDGTEPCRPTGTGSPTPAVVPTWAHCESGTAAWALRTEGGTVLRRCADSLVLVHAGETSSGPVQELGSSVCAEFDENFDAPAGTRTILCVSDPKTEDTLQANPTGGDDSTIWFDEVVARYVGN